MKYSKGFKYQLEEDFTCKTSIYPRKNIKTKFIDLSKSGYLTIREGYAWDGASGPTIDTDSSMRGGLVHDALYQLMRREWLSQDWRALADIELLEWIKKDGMNGIRAYWWHREVKKWAASAADPESRRIIYEVP